MWILVIEAQREEARLLDEMLRSALPAPTEIETVEQLSGALECLSAAAQPDLILLDLLLPGSSGLDALTPLLQAAPRVPVLLLIGPEDEQLALQAVRAGAQDCILKAHLSPPDLRRAIQHAIERKRSLAAQEAMIADLEAFAHSVAHDLKHPLHLMMGYLDLIREEYRTAPAEEMDEFIGQALGYARKMNALIEEFLTLATLRYDQDLVTEPLDMGAVVLQAIETLMPVIQDRQAEIVLPATWPTALGHPVWIEQVWVNYLSNALNYGGQPPRIELGGTLQPDGSVRFWVRDNGHGIDEALREQLFSPLAGPASSSFQGHGFGLSIVRQIIEKLHGHAALESHPGQGSTFSFTLPCADNPSG